MNRFAVLEMAVEDRCPLLAREASVQVIAWLLMPYLVRMFPAMNTYAFVYQPRIPTFTAADKFKMKAFPGEQVNHGSPFGLKGSGIGTPAIMLAANIDDPAPSFN